MRTGSSDDLFSSSPEPSLPSLIGRDRLLEDRLVKIWPKGICEDEFRVGELPKQKITEPNFPTGPKQKIWIGQSVGTQGTIKMVLVYLVRTNSPGNT
jgi:hypothetical protein